MLKVKVKNNHEINWNLAELCAEMVEEAYNDIDTMEAYLIKHKIKYSKIKFFSNGSAQAYGIKMHDYTVIAFRGTEPTQFGDILADVKAWPAHAETVGHVHGGFKTELDKLWPAMTKWLGKSIATRKFVICGHSLGAAMATICATRIHLVNKDISLYTYGCPRVGTKEWGEQFSDIANFRFVNNNDIVPHVPPFGYYEHIGELYYISYTDHIQSHTTWLHRLRDKLAGRCKAWSKFQFFDNFYDHLSANYLKKLLRRK